ATTADSTVSILLATGDGSFKSHVDIAVGAIPTALAGADFNGDGKPDLMTTNEGANSVSVLLGKGDGAFTRVDSSAGISPTNLVVGDFNNDGKPDAILSNGYPQGLVFLLGKGDGTFANPTPIPKIDASILA